jgi:hypothetical protein
VNKLDDKSSILFSSYLVFFYQMATTLWSSQVCHHLMWNPFWDAHHFGSLRKLKTKWLPWIHHVVTDHHCLNMNILNTQMHVPYQTSMRLLFIHVHTQDPPTPLLPKTCRFLYKPTWHVHFKRIWILMFIHTQCPNWKPLMPVPSQYVQMNIPPNTGS